MFPGSFSAVLPMGSSDEFPTEQLMEGARHAFPLIERDWQPTTAFFRDPVHTFDMNAVLPWTRLERMEVYQTYWRPCRLERQLLAFLGSPTMPLGVICLARGKRSRGFSQADVALLDRVRQLTEPALASLAAEAAHSETSCVLAALAEGLPTPCALLDEAGRVLWLNDEAARRTGTEATRIGLTCILGKQPSMASQWHEAIAECLRRGGGPGWCIGRLTIREIRCPDGRLVYLVVDPEPVRVRGSSLSAREWEVAQLAARGFAIINIAAQLGLSDGTVRNHLKNIYRKMGVRSRASLAATILGW